MNGMDSPQRNEEVATALLRRAKQMHQRLANNNNESYMDSPACASPCPSPAMTSSWGTETAAAATTTSSPMLLQRDVCTVCLQGISPYYGGGHHHHHRSSRRSSNSGDSGKSSGGGGGDHRSCPGYTLACGHRFHAACIGRWLDQHSSCPSCGRLVAAVTRLVLSSSQVPLPPDTPGNEQPHQQPPQQQQQQPPEDAFAWLLSAAVWVAVLALGIAMLEWTGRV